MACTQTVVCKSHADLVLRTQQIHRDCMLANRVKQAKHTYRSACLTAPLSASATFVTRSSSCINKRNSVRQHRSTLSLVDPNRELVVRHSPKPLIYASKLLCNHRLQWFGSPRWHETDQQRMVPDLKLLLNAHSASTARTGCVQHLTMICSK